MSAYDDIINRSRPRSRRPPMSMHDRAAQFSPFAALTGHSAALAEVARTTEDRKALSDEERNALNRTLALLQDRIDEQPIIRATYFIPDPLKTGGAYAVAEGSVRTIDTIDQRLKLTDDRAIPLLDIVSLTIVPPETPKSL